MQSRLAAQPPPVSKRSSVTDTIESARSTAKVSELKEQARSLGAEVQELRQSLRRKQDEVDDLKAKVRLVPLSCWCSLWLLCCD